MAWKLLVERQYKSLPQTASKIYLEGLETVGFSTDRIPDFSDVDRKLGKITG